MSGHDWGSPLWAAQTLWAARTHLKSLRDDVVGERGVLSQHYDKHAHITDRFDAVLGTISHVIRDIKLYQGLGYFAESDTNSCDSPFSVNLPGQESCQEILRRNDTVEIFPCTVFQGATAPVPSPSRAPSPESAEGHESRTAM